MCYIALTLKLDAVLVMDISRSRSVSDYEFVRAPIEFVLSLYWISHRQKIGNLSMMFELCTHTFFLFNDCGIDEKRTRELYER